MKRREGFTLIELLVVISIIGFIAGLTVLIGPSLQRNQAASRGVEQVQAQLYNAKQIALRDNRLYGIRFLNERNGTSRSMQYIFQPDDHDPGRVTLRASDTTLVEFTVDISGGLGTDRTVWPIQVGDFIAYLGPQPHRIASIVNNVQVRLATPINTTTDIITSDARIFRNPCPAPGEEIVLLPTDVIVDLSRSNLKRDSATTHYDVLFSPGGPVVGSAAPIGKIVLWVRDTNVNYTTAREQGLIAVFTRSGSIGSYLVDTSDPAAVAANPAAAYTYTNDPRTNGL